MLLNRSISISEFNALLDGQVLYGRYDLSKENQSTCNRKNVFSFFAGDYWWIDSGHRFSIIVDIPENRLFYGEGTYYVAKSFEKTHIWTGRRGSVEYKIPEYYCDSYSINDVVALSGIDCFNNNYQKMYSQKLSEYGIKIMLSPTIKQSGDFKKCLGLITNIERLSPDDEIVNGCGYYNITVKLSLDGDEVYRTKRMWTNISDIKSSNVSVYVLKKTLEGCFIDIFDR